MGVSVALALLWIAILRRPVAKHTRQIRLRLEREAALENRYRRLFEGNLASVWRATRNGRILDCNAATAHLPGAATPGELIGENIAGTCFSVADWAAIRGRLAAAGKVTAYGASLRTRDGRPVFVLANMNLSSREDLDRKANFSPT